MGYLSIETKVKIHPYSRFVNQGKINGKFIEGIIVKVNPDSEWCYNVHWKNGVKNSYKISDILPLEQEQDNYEIY